MDPLDTSWEKISYDYTSLEPAFMDLLKDAAARLGVEVDHFVVEALRERATAVLNGPELPTWEAAVAKDVQRKKAEAASRALQEHAAVLDCLRQRGKTANPNTGPCKTPDPRPRVRPGAPASGCREDNGRGHQQPILPETGRDQRRARAGRMPEGAART